MWWKRRGLWVGVVLVLAVGAGFAYRPAEVDPIADLWPWVISERITYSQPRTGSPFGTKYREVTLKGVSMQKFLDVMNRRFRREGDWSKPFVGRYEYFMFSAAKLGPGANEQAIYATGRLDGLEKKVITPEIFETLPIRYQETTPISRGQLLWLRLHNGGRDPRTY